MEQIGCRLRYLTPFGFNFMSVKLEDVDSHFNILLCFDILRLHKIKILKSFENEKRNGVIDAIHR